MADALYPRTVTIERPNSQFAAGAANAQLSQPGGKPYFGLDRTAGGNTVIASNVPASLQSLGGRAQRSTNLPSSAPGPTRWKIVIPATAMQLGIINDRDIVIDDLGKRYMVSSDYYTALGYELEAIRLEN
jgi:hypothetical protein